MNNWTDAQAVFVREYEITKDKLHAAHVAYPQATEREAWRWLSRSKELMDWLWEQEHPNEVKCSREFLLGTLVDVMEAKGVKGNSAKVSAVALAARLLGLAGRKKKAKGEEKPEQPISPELAERLRQAVN